MEHPERNKRLSVTGVSTVTYKIYRETFATAKGKLDCFVLPCIQYVVSVRKILLCKLRL
jgi:hypothetical protein